jgi:predicted RNA methylase
MKTSGYIRRHLDYVTRRATSLRDQLRPGKEQEDIHSIIAELTGSDRNHHYTGIKEIDELKSLLETWDIINEGDLLGQIYQILQNRNSRKNKGQFFTPEGIVLNTLRESLNLYPDIEDITLLDPACGSGHFLIHAFHFLRARNERFGIDPDESISRIINHSLTGFDVDPTAVIISRYNLAQVSGRAENEIRIFRSDFLFRDDLSLTRSEEFDDGYDIIIGNPPWGSNISPERKRYYRREYISAKSGINSFTLFIERAFDLIKQGGAISFLVPEAYLNIKAHRESRKLVLSNGMIKTISRWGEQFKNVFAPSVSITIQQEKDPAKRKKNIVKIFSNRPREQSMYTMVPQDYYQRDREYFFNVHYSRKSIDTLKAIESGDSFYLKDRARFFLGIVTGNNSHFISTRQTPDSPDPIIVGKDLAPFNIRFSHHYFKYNPGVLQQVAPQHLYLSRGKILYRFIGKNLTFAREDMGYYTLNNVNGFIPSKSEINDESLVSVLNSRVIQYFYEKNFFTVKVLRGNLERIPIRRISLPNQKLLKCLHDRMLESDQNEKNRIRETIEDVIMLEYGLKDASLDELSG